MKQRVKILATLIFLFLLFSLPGFAQVRLENGKDLRKALNLNSYDTDASRANLSQLKIAVLDDGFQGFDPTKKQLPESTELIEGPVNPQSASDHGLKMAMATWAMTGWNKVGPKFYLINSNGFSNFKAAIDFVIENKVDIVLYSMVFPYGGNYDGRGFINKEVSRATKAGVFWINAAGNYSKLVYNDSVRAADGDSGRVRLSGKADTIRFRSNLDEQSVSITLSWNDFTDSTEDRTTKDLDFYLYNSAGTLVYKAEKVQDGVGPKTKEEEATKSGFAREAAELTLDKDEYYVEIYQRSQNFDPKADKLRLVVQSNTTINGVELLTQSNPAEEIFPPADHPDVFTIADKEEGVGSVGTVNGLVKPDLRIEKTMLGFSNGQSGDGSSTAAALFAGVVLNLKSYYPNLAPKHLKNYISKMPNEFEDSGPYWVSPSPDKLLRYIR